MRPFPRNTQAAVFGLWLGKGPPLIPALGGASGVRPVPHSLRIGLWAHSKFSHRNQWYLLLCCRATWARKGFLGTSSLKSEPQKAGGSDRALAQRLGRRGAGKDGIRGRCAGSRRPSSPAGPWLAGPGGNRRHPRHPAWKDRALPGRVTAGVTPATLRTSFSEVGRGTSESARTSVPRGTVREGRSHCRARAPGAAQPSRFPARSGHSA